MVTIYTKLIVLYNIFLFKRKKIVFGPGLRIRGIVGLEKRMGSTITIGRSLNISSGNMSNPIGRNMKTCISVRKNAHLSIGDNVGISSACLWCSEKIIIGNNVKIGALTIIMDTDAHSLDPTLRSNYKTDGVNAAVSPIVIEDNVFIGANCYIGKGTVIGKNSIIGAGSVVVNKTIPENEIWAGNPIRFVRMLNI